MAKELSYTENHDPEWSVLAIDLFDVTPLPNAHRPVAVDLDGRCPRCREPMQDTVFLIAYSGVSSMTRDEKLHAIEALQDMGVIDESPLPTEVSVQCVCDTTHPDPLGRKDLHGCGAIWRMRFEAFDEDAA
jgi:hypothetical protein